MEPRLWQCIAPPKSPKTKPGTCFNRRLRWQPGITPILESSIWQAISPPIRITIIEPSETKAPGAPCNHGAPGGGKRGRKQSSDCDRQVGRSEERRGGEESRARR